MELKNLKRRLFGFEKNSVFEYIAELNRECAEKVENERKEKSESLKNLNAVNEELNNRLICLESENDSLKKQMIEKEEAIERLKTENERLISDTDARKAVETEVAEILTEARNFAELLRNKAERENEAFRNENKKTYDEEKQKLSEYARDIAEVKSAINSVLAEAKVGLERAEARVAVLEKR